MNIKYMFKLLAYFAVLIIISLGLYGQPTGRSVRNFNPDWKFYKGDISNGQNPDLDDSDWRQIVLPHDWSIEGPFSSGNYSCTGYLPGGIGWYRKSFTIPQNEVNRKVVLYFEGIYDNSEVWINGIRLGYRPNGYISFGYDLTPYLKFGEKNIIAVKVDHSLYGDSRWYTGSGIYRNVFLITSEKVNIKQWGVYCNTPVVNASEAILNAEISLANETKNDVTVKVTSILKFEGKTVGRSTSRVMINAGKESVVSQNFEIKNPRLWDVDEPNLYTLETEVVGRELLDNTIRNIGFRDIKFDPDKGFFLNGKSMKLKGICMHHDAGALGSAVPAEEISRRLDILKEMGCNAIRTSHNPFSPEFLDLCDSKGFLVIGEAFDEWELPKKKWLAGWNVGTPGKEGYSTCFKEWSKRDLSDFILRDRNHPSIIMWSIGNEVDYPNDPYSHPILNTEANPQTWARYNDTLPNANRLGEIARELVSVVKELDTTRPVTAGLASALMSNETGYADALDVAGYNYQEFRYEPDHISYPKRPLYGSENGMTLDMWNYVEKNEYVMGQFLWTGFEYIGEAGRYPSRSNTAGVIDLAGNKKPEFYFRQSLWSDKPMVFIGTSDRINENGPVNLWSHKRVEPRWNWTEGKMISVNVFTNCEEVELFLNDRSLGTKKAADFSNRTLSWEVPFEKGTIVAFGKNNGDNVAEYRLKTTGDPALLKAYCDEAALTTDINDITRVFVEVDDEGGGVVYTASNEISCETEGPVILLGMEDSNPMNTEDYKDNSQHAYHGRLLIYLRSNGDAGTARLKLSSPGLTGTTVEIPVIK